MRTLKFAKDMFLEKKIKSHASTNFSYTIDEVTLNSLTI